MKTLDAVSYSELCRRPDETWERVFRSGALRLRRRKADDLILRAADVAETESEVFGLLLRLLPADVSRDSQVYHDALPWLRFLPAGEVGRFAAEFAETVEAGEAAAVQQMVIEWKHTAEIYADPELLRVLTSPFGDDLAP
ncbi:hypothetical protein [Symbioplanes lichenis]|uniref:hypothetical protein n=1 Tax=Symbioplanes lichenis TaxID=1629072 RepID=UPI0027382E9F|nr:hypothetical protein [Actinoplanes lichenis]